jgi:MTH538 TIR-like domain (DUF1863)
MSSLTPKWLGGRVPGTTLTSVGRLETAWQSGLGSLLGALSTPRPPYVAPAAALYGKPRLPFLPATKRKAYFAFRFEDIMRVNNVRNAWCIDHPDSPAMRSFRDRSIWGKSKAQEPESLKALMRDAVIHSSAVCVLVGTNTWQGRWVKYEIARAVADKRGLLAVHLNGLNHHQRQTSDTRGYNPLRCMGIYHSLDGHYYIYELKSERDPTTGQLAWKWRQYEDFKGAVDRPRYIPSVAQGYVEPLASHTSEYDYVAPNGHGNIGAWIDRAAVAVGR